MPNLERLARVGVSASAAFSPARDTEASIPALLTGYELAGLNYGDHGELWLKTRSEGVRRFLRPTRCLGVCLGARSRAPSSAIFIRIA